MTVGFMRDQAPRLLRERWSDTNDLAEEIYAIWTSEKPVQFDSPITINNSTGGSAVTINQGSVSGPSITINSSPVPGVQIPDFPPSSLNVTSSYVTNFYGDGSAEGFPEPPVRPPEPGGGQPVGGGGGGGFPGRVLSGGGSTYEVAVYEAGLLSSPVTRSVRQLQISGSASIPAGTWALVGKAGTTYFMQVAVWL